MTTRLPHPVLHAACYPLSVLLYVTIVAPYRHLCNRPRAQVFVKALPLKTYADYPFAVLVNDQFDRFSAPIEHRFSKQEVFDALAGLGLQEISVLPNAGWVGDAKVPEQGVAATDDSQTVTAINPALPVPRTGRPR